MHCPLVSKLADIRRLASLVVGCLTAATIGLTFPALAAPDPLLSQAVGLLERHDAAAAYALLQGEEPRLAGTPDYDYLLGISALDAGHVTRAIFALERVVLSQPDNALAHAELARALLAAGEADRAREELTLARRATPPTAAAAAIDRVLGALDQALPSPALKWSAYGEVGLGRDSNVNSANQAGEFAIPAFGGLLFAVDPQNRRRGDSFAFAAAGATLQRPLAADWKLIATLNGRIAANRHLHTMDTSSLDGTLGLSHSAGAHSQTVAFQSNTAWVASGVYRSANGASAQWQSQFDAASQWSAFLQWARLEYAGQAERNTDRTVLGTAYARAFAATGTLGYASVYGAEESVRRSGYTHFGHRGVGARLGAEQSLPGRTVPLVLFAEWQRERRHHGATEPLFDAQRIDRQTDVLVGLRWTPAPTWSVVPSVRHTSAHSNVPLYAYGRTVVQVALRKEFP